MAKKNTISLCMIVKNEEEFLAQCLESVKDIVDEMIIVDTGSTDRTVEIAKAYGAKLFFYQWDGSFSKARNFGLQYATCDWILQLDADEVLERKDVPLLKKVIRQKEYVAVFLALLNETKEGWAKHYFQRLFQRGKAHFEGIVHNQLVYKGKHLVTEIRIYHYGYNLSGDKMKAKYKRTEELLLRQLSEDQANAFAWRNYIRILRSQRRYEELMAEAERAFILCKDTISDVNRQLIAYDLVYALTQLDRFKEAEEMVNDYLHKYPDNYDLWFTKGIAQMGQKKYREAITTFRHFIKLKESGVEIHPQIICDTYTLQHKAHAMIGDAYMEMQQVDKALKSVETAIELAPEIAIYRLSLARIYAAQGSPEKAKKELDFAVSKLAVDEAFFMKWSNLCRAYPLLGNAFEALRKGIRHIPESDTLYNQAAYMIHDAQPEEAVELWKKTLMINDRHIGAMAGLVKVYFTRGDFKKMEEQAQEILNISTAAPILRDIAHFCAMAKKYELAIRLLSEYLENNPNDQLMLARLSHYYALNGQSDAALLGVQEILRQKPANPAVLQLLKKIQQQIMQPQTV